MFYTDANTFTGADPDPLFDADDEFVFMAKDAGGKFSGLIFPAGIMNGTGQELTISDPLGGVGYLYLFQQDGSLRQDAGLSYVNYTFQLSNGGTYPNNFVFLNARNNENSTVATSNYSCHFSGELITDELKITTGGAPNTNILDRHKYFFANNNCVRTEDTFSDGDNAFVTNKSGPIRAIRSIMGANSGPLTQRTNVFYQARQDIITDFRVHNIASIYDAFDYNSNANGSKYRNNLNNVDGIVINGTKDVVSLGSLSWELVSGQKGSLVILHTRNTNLLPSDAVFTSYYDDAKTRPASNCTGDKQAWGTSGVGIQFQNGSVCTDPLSSGCGVNSASFRKVATTRVVYFEAPGTSANTAINYNNQLSNPFVVSVVPLIGATLQTQAAPELSNLFNQEQRQLTSHIKLSPNPAKRTCTVSYFSNNGFRSDLMVFDILGNVVLKKNVVISKGTNTFRLETNRLASGLYFIRLANAGIANVERLVVQ